MIRGLIGAVALAVSLVAAPTAGADPVSDLMGLLPHGYGPGNCHPESPRVSGMTAFVRCGQNTEPGGPSGGNFGLFVNDEAMYHAFNSLLKTMGPTGCPPLPPGAMPVADVMTCGINADGPRIMTMLIDELVLGVVFGSSLEGLRQWGVE